MDLAESRRPVRPLRPPPPRAGPGHRPQRRRLRPPTKSISAEDTLEHDIPLDATEDIIRRMAEKVWTASRKRVPHRPHRSPQAQNQGIQHPHPKSHSARAASLRRRTRHHRPGTLRAACNLIPINASDSSASACTTFTIPAKSSTKRPSSQNSSRIDPIPTKGRATQVSSGEAQSAYIWTASPSGLYFGTVLPGFNRLKRAQTTPMAYTSSGGTSFSSSSSNLQFQKSLLLLVAGLGGLLYGVDVGIIGGALPYLEATSGLSAGAALRHRRRRIARQRLLYIVRRSPR